jgi:hypothetical protein
VASLVEAVVEVEVPLSRNRPWTRREDSICVTIPQPEATGGIGEATQVKLRNVVVELWPGHLKRFLNPGAARTTQATGPCFLELLDWQGVGDESLSTELALSVGVVRRSGWA